MDSPEQVERLERVGPVVAEAIAAVRRAAVSGVSTGGLDAVAQGASIVGGGARAR
ncbi:MAG: hypothetical protein M3Y17_05260 [Actinomycetota bacterium]|nr:hypothetical protein [Actinomycetota bacterium]